MNTARMVELQANVIETTITCKASVVDEWIRTVLPTAHCFQNIVGYARQSFCSNTFSEVRVRDGTSLLQVCIGTKCLLYQPLYFNTDKPRLLDSLFRDPGFIFVGVDVLENMRGLHAFRPGTSIDIEELAVERWCWPKQGVYWKPGLKVLAKSVADLDISQKMPQHVRLSGLGGYSKVELTSVEQIEYAAVEVYALFRIGCKMLKHGYAVPNMMKSASDDDDE